MKIGYIIFAALVIGVIYALLGFNTARKENIREKTVESKNVVIDYKMPFEEESSWKTVRMTVSAYCPCSICCGKWADGYTATNHKIQDGDCFVAAPKTYAFGTEMIIPGYNNSRPVEVLDRGGAIKGNKLDVFFNTHDLALQWGVQELDVSVREQ